MISGECKWERRGELMKRAGFTLLELLTVIIIISILVTLAVTHYGGAKEKVLDKEAISNLKLIRAAERSFKVEMNNQYYPLSGNVSSIVDINQNLSIMLSNASNRYWNYIVFSNGCAQAIRNGGDGRYWNLPVANEEPDSSYTCP
jgi:prepilin-type N-terminal cleavage/methylation domain-containing protein